MEFLGKYCSFPLSHFLLNDTATGLEMTNDWSLDQISSFHNRCPTAHFSESSHIGLFPHCDQWINVAYLVINPRFVLWQFLGQGRNQGPRVAHQPNSGKQVVPINPNGCEGSEACVANAANLGHKHNVLERPRPGDHILRDPGYYQVPSHRKIIPDSTSLHDGLPGNEHPPDSTCIYMTGLSSPSPGGC